MHGKGEEVVVSLFVLSFGLAAVVASFEIPVAENGSWGGRLFPLLSSIALSTLGAFDLWGSCHSSTGQSSAKGVDRKSFFRVFALLLIALAYYWLLGEIGYLASTSVAILLTLIAFGVRNPYLLLLSMVLCPVAYHYVFFVLLGVFPPYGEWFDLAAFMFRS